MSNGAYSMYDAVHGPIELADRHLFGCEDILPPLLESPHLQRLRRIKLLPFGSYRFPAADHTRFAHAIGTAHAALRLLQRLHRTGFFGDENIRVLRNSLPHISDRHKKDADFVRSTAEHIVIAGLLQDIGELPCKPATDLFFYAHSGVIDRVNEELGTHAAELSHKDIFTLHGIIDLFEANAALRATFELDLLAYLITGLEIGNIAASSELRALRQLLDGVIDADRLDYVHRDAYHTIGASSFTSVAHIVNSLLTYDENGPIFTSPEPVSNFLMLRAILRAQVYSAPENRFRITLLAVVLSEFLRRHPEWMESCFDAPLGSLTAEGFSRLDDVSFLTALGELRARRESERLEYGARRAIDMMISHGADYEYFWLNRAAEYGQVKPTQLRSDIFVDTYWDYENHALYEPGSVRVRADQYTLIGETIPLEMTGGHVSEFFQQLWNSPIQDKVLLFVPTNRRDWFIQRHHSGVDSQVALYRAAIARDAEVRLSVVDDTREEPGHTGAPIFLSFCWDDIDTMRAVLRLLYDRRRRYFAFVQDFHGLGGDPKENGAAYAGEAEAAILLLSAPYLKRTQDPNGNIYAELVALGRRLRPDNIVVLSLDSLKDYGPEIKNGPWTLLGFREPPYLGPPIRGASIEVLGNAVDAALEIFDRKR